MKLSLDPLKNFGLTPYGEGMRILNELHAAVIAGELPSQVVFMQHPSVITFGKNANWANLLGSNDLFQSLAVDVVTTDRGGQVTAHSPGQLMFYPIINLYTFRFGVKSFVALVEKTLAITMQEFGIRVDLDPLHPGLWHQNAKIAAVGLRFKRGATLHGAAVYVDNTTELFDYMIPCGIRGRGVTTMQKLLSKKITVDEVMVVIDSTFRKLLRCESGALEKSF